MWRIRRCSRLLQQLRWAGSSVSEEGALQDFITLKPQNLSVRAIEKTLLSSSASHIVEPKSGSWRKIAILWRHLGDANVVVQHPVWNWLLITWDCLLLRERINFTYTPQWPLHHPIGRHRWLHRLQKHCPQKNDFQTHILLLWARDVLFNPKMNRCQNFLKVTFSSTRLHLLPNLKVVVQWRRCYSVISPKDKKQRKQHCLVIHSHWTATGPTALCTLTWWFVEKQFLHWDELPELRLCSLSVQAQTQPHLPASSANQLETET